MTVHAETLVLAPGRASRQRRQALIGLGLFLPSAALVLAFTIFPVAYNVWLGFFAIPAAAAAAFVSVSDRLEGKPRLVHAVSNSLALAFIVLESAVRSNAAGGGAAPPLATWALLAALFAYAVPTVAWVLEPMKVTR